jgi:dethiobiotin synthetase
MKSLYVTSVERYSGKTATCLALGLRLKADGYKVNYLKPLSVQPWRVTDASGKVHVADEDAGFVKNILELPSEPWELSPVVITPEFLSQHIESGQTLDLMPELQRMSPSMTGIVLAHVRPGV